MHKSSKWASLGLCVATLLPLLLLFVDSTAAMTYEIGMPMFIGDTKRDQILLAATHAADVAFNESLKAVGADLAITYRVIPRFSVANPLSHVILTNELLTPNLIAAFDATRGEVRLPSYLLANASVPYLTFDSSILSTNPTSINLDFSQTLWADLTKKLLLSIGITRVGSIAAPSFATLSSAFTTQAAAAGVNLVYQFNTGVTYDDLRFRLSKARSLGVVYFVVFGSAADLFEVINVASKERFFFEYIWVAAGRAPIAKNDFDELYNLNKPDPQFFSGLLSIMLPTSNEVTNLLLELQERAPSLFQINKKRVSAGYTDIDDRVVIVHDYIRLVGCTIAKIINDGLDPLTATAPLPGLSGEYPFLPFLVAASNDFVGTTGKFTFNNLLSRDGLLGVFNWKFRDNTTSWTPIGSFANGTFQWIPYYTRDNICWSSSTPGSSTNTWWQPSQDESRVLKLGMLFRSTSFRNQYPEWIAAARWAVDYANQKILSYYKFNFDHMNLGSSTATTVAAVRVYLDKESPAVVVGPVTTPLSTALMPLMQERGTPLISPNAPGESLSNPLYYKGFARVMDSDRSWAQGLFLFMRKMGWATFAAVSSAEETKVIDELQLGLPSDFRMSARASFEWFNTTVYSLETIEKSLNVLKQSRARVFVLRSAANSLPLYLSIAKQMGMFGAGAPYVWVFGTEVKFLRLTSAAAATGALGNLTPQDFTGSFAIAPHSIPSDDRRGMFDRLTAHLSGLGLPDNVVDDSPVWSPETLTIYWVDTILSVANAIETMYKNEGLKVQNNGPKILDYLLRVSFEGASGLVALNDFGSRLNLTQTGVNFNGTHWVTIYSYSNSTGEGKMLRDISTFVWSDRTVAPLDRFGVSYSSGIGLAIVLITALVQLVIVGTIAVVVKHRKHKLIFSSSPLFLSLILIGLTIAASTNYAWLGDVWFGSCITQKFFFYIGFSIAFGALLIKNWRIYALFTDQSMQVIAITNTRLLAYMGIISSSFAIILILWASVDAPVPSPAHISGFWCAPRSGTPAWDIVINALAILGLLAGVVLAFLTRNMPAIYNEGKYIGFATYNLVITLMGGLILAYFIQGIAGVEAGIIVGSFAIIISCGGVFAFLFAPKLYVMFYEPHKVSQLWEDRTGVAPGTSRTATGTGSRTKTFSSSNSKELNYVSNKSENSQVNSKKGVSGASVRADPGDSSSDSDSSSTSTSDDK